MNRELLHISHDSIEQEQNRFHEKKRQQINVLLEEANKLLATAGIQTPISTILYGVMRWGHGYSDEKGPDNTVAINF